MLVLIVCVKVNHFDCPVKGVDGFETEAAILYVCGLKKKGIYE